MNNPIPEDDQLCASIIRNVLKAKEEDRTASSSKSTLGVRNQVYALRQLMLGRPVLIPGTISRTASSGSNTYPIRGRGIGPNKVYELRRLLFAGSRKLLVQEIDIGFGSPNRLSLSR